VTAPATHIETNESSENNRRHLSVFGLDFVGLVVALLFFAWSLSPSLIPREWYFQGLISGVTGIVGYGPSCTRLVCQPGPGIRDAEGVEDVHGVVGERVEGGVLVAGDRDGDFLQGTQGPHDLPDRHPGRVLQIA